MGARDLGGDVEPEPETLPGVVGDAVEWLEQPLDRLRRDRLAGIRAPTVRTGLRACWRAREPALSAVPWIKRIAEQIGKQLRDAAAVAIDRSRQIEIATSIARSRISSCAAPQSHDREPARAAAPRGSAAMPPPSRPRAKSSRLSISADIRADALLHQREDRSRLLLLPRSSNSWCRPRSTPAGCAGRGRARR